MQLHAWVLQVPFTRRNCGCEGKSQNDDRHTYLQERLHHPGHVMQTMESQTLSLPIPDKENADLPRIRRQTWQSTTHKYLSTWQNHLTAQDPNPQMGS